MHDIYVAILNDFFPDLVPDGNVKIRRECLVLPVSKAVKNGGIIWNVCLLTCIFVCMCCLLIFLLVVIIYSCYIFRLFMCRHPMCNKIKPHNPWWWVKFFSLFLSCEAFLEIWYNVPWSSDRIWVGVEKTGWHGIEFEAYQCHQRVQIWAVQEVETVNFWQDMQM